MLPSNHLILCRPLLLPPSIFPSIRVFSKESALHIRWPKYWSFSLNISPSSEYPGLISFRMDRLIPLQSKGLSVSFSLGLSYQEASISLLSFCIRGKTDWKPQSHKMTNLITWTTALSNSMELWSMPCRATQDRRVMLESSDKTWSTGEGSGKPLQYSCLENPMNSMKRQKDRILKDELPRSVDVQYATGDQWRNNSRKNKETEPKQK